MITASLKNYRISPRKVRLVADMIRGKKVADAKNILDHVVKKAGNPIGVLLDSAIANASHNHQIDRDSLFVKEIRVDQGYVLKRSQPMARGSAFPIAKRTSHIAITLAPTAEMKETKADKKAKNKKATIKKSK